MTAMRDSDLVVRRLRGLGLIPEGTGAVLERDFRSRGVPEGTKVLWHARDAVTREPLGVSSRWAMGTLLKCEDWELAKDGDVTWVAPGGRP